MNNQRKTQLSLILLAGVASAGLLGWFFQSMSKNFTLYPNAPQTAQAVPSPESVPDSQNPAAEVGAVLGETDNAPANPLRGIYVNPFGQ